VRSIANGEPVMATRLALVDDHPTLLKGLAGIFSSDPAYEVVATGGSAGEAVAIVEAHQPEVIGLDLSMPGDIFAAIDRMARISPQLKLVVFTAFANVELALKALDAGAHAFVLKGRPTEDLFDAIKTVGRGELYVSPEFTRGLFNGIKNRARQPAPATITLTARERQVVGGLLQAQTTAEIARALGLTEKLVGHYLTGLKTKLHARNRLEIIAAVEALDRGKP
jgi:DNA-binding NarL/FixJ family response regulator